MSVFDDAILRRIHRDEMGEALDEQQTRKELDYLDHALTQRPAEIARLVYALSKVGKDEGRTRIADLERFAELERGASPTIRESLRGNWVGSAMRGVGALAVMYGFVLAAGLLTPKDEGTRQTATWAIIAMIAGGTALWYVGPRPLDR